MVYRMVMYVDGGCRNNGYSNAIGAAACVNIEKWGRREKWHRKIPSHEGPTNQRCEIIAIIVALKLVLQRYEELDSYPRLNITIYTDSKYAHGCITDWQFTWMNNGWINSRGYEVANRDLIQEASNLDNQVQALGDVNYIWISRSENDEADELCNEVLDEME